MQTLSLDQDKLFQIVLRHYNIPKGESKGTKIEIKLDFDLEPRLIDHYFLEYECKDPHDKERAKGIKYINAPKGKLSLGYGRTIENLIDKDVTNAYLELDKPFPVTMDDAKYAGYRSDFMNEIIPLYSDDTQDKIFSKKCPNNMPASLADSSLEAEQAVLGAIFAGDKKICQEVLSKLTPGDFYRESHYTIFKAIVHMACENRDIDPLTVSEHLASLGKLDEVGGRYYIGLLLSRAPIANTVHTYCEIVQQKSKERQENK